MKYWDEIISFFKGEEKKLPIPGMDDKTSLILLLIKMAEIDGDLSHFEQMNIHLLSNTMGVDMMKVNQWRGRLDEVVLVLPKTKEERIDYFWRLLTMMKMDLYAHPKELEMCRELGRALKFKKQKVEEAITLMNDNMERSVPYEEIYELVN